MRKYRQRLKENGQSSTKKLSTRKQIEKKREYWKKKKIKNKEQSSQVKPKEEKMKK